MQLDNSFDREQIIAELVLRTGFAESAFTKMTDEQLQQEHERRLGE